jgi:outer membrane biosynthesis protein TonB
MQMTIEALIVALRGAANALENLVLPFDDGYDVEEAPEPQRAPKPAPEPAPEAEAEPAPEADPAPPPVVTAVGAPAPWETEITSSQVEEVTSQDIIALYQEVSQAGKKVDMLKLLSELGVERVGELDGEGRAKLHAAIKKSAGM